MKNNENTAPKRWLWLTEIYLQTLSKKSEVDSCVEFLGSLGSRTEIQRRLFGCVRKAQGVCSILYAY